MRPTLLSRLGVESSERALFLWAGGCLGLQGSAAFALLNTAETLFLKRVGVEYLPVVLLASAGLLVVTTGLLNRGLAARDRSEGLVRVFLGLALLLLPFEPLIHRAVPGSAWLLLLAARQILGLGILAFWLALNDLVTGRQAKRLFAPLAAGTTVGGILGSFASEPIARVAGVEGIPLVCAALLVAAAGCARRLRRAQPSRFERARSAVGHASDAADASFAGLWRRYRLFRLLVVSLFCGGLLSPVLYFQFSYVADAATTGADGEQRLLALFAQFRGWLNVAMLGAQLWLGSRLYRRLGLPLSLALWPLTYLAGFAWLGVDPALRAAVPSLGAARLSEDGIAGSALRVLVNLFPDAVRSRAAGLIEGPVNRLGGVLGNTGVMLALPLGGASWIRYAALPVAVFWLAAALALRRAYPTLLLQASADRSLLGAGSERQMLLDPTTLRALAPYLSDPDPRLCRAALDLLADAEPALAVGLLAGALHAAPEENRPLLVEALQRTVEPRPPGQLRSPEASAGLAKLLEHDAGLPPEQRADLIQVYARLTGGGAARRDEAALSLRILERALGDREAAVRLAAIAELQRRGRPPPGVADLDRVLAGALAARDALMRRTARKELRAMLLSSRPDAQWEQRLALLAQRLEHRVDRAETAEALVEVARRHGSAARPCAEAMLRWAEDRDPRVRAAVLAFAGRSELGAEAPRLARALASRDAEEVEAAREGLIALGPEAVRSLLVEHEFAAPAQRDAVLAILAELEIETDRLVEIYRNQRDAVRHALVLRGALGPDPAAKLVARRLEERVDESFGTLLALLAVLQDDARIAELEHRLRRAADGRRRDVVLEALDTLLPPGDRQELLPLLEARSWEDRGRTAAAQLGLPWPAAEDVWQQLPRDRDELTRRLAAAALERQQGMGDAPPVLSPMDVAVHLQEVPAFDRLSTRQLVRLAEALVEERREAGDSIYAEGDEGSCLYFVLEGAVELSKQGLSLDRVEPGGFFGELATLDGVPRPLSARAEADVRLLRLDREELLAMMEEAPALAIGLAQFLSLRIRRLQEMLKASR